MKILPFILTEILWMKNHPLILGQIYTWGYNWSSEGSIGSRSWCRLYDRLCIKRNRKKICHYNNWVILFLHPWSLLEDQKELDSVKGNVDSQASIFITVGSLLLLNLVVVSLHKGISIDPNDSMKANLFRSKNMMAFRTSKTFTYRIPTQGRRRVFNIHQPQKWDPCIKGCHQNSRMAAIQKAHRWKSPDLWSFFKKMTTI